MNLPAGEYSKRTSEGVRNSKRALPASTLVVDSAPAAHDHAGARPSSSQHGAAVALEWACTKLGDLFFRCGGRRAVRGSGTRILIGNQDVHLQLYGSRYDGLCLTSGVIVDVAHREQRQDLLRNLLDELAVSRSLECFAVTEQ